MADHDTVNGHEARVQISRIACSVLPLLAPLYTHVSFSWPHQVKAAVSSCVSTTCSTLLWAQVNGVKWWTKINPFPFFKLFFLGSPGFCITHHHLSSQKSKRLQWRESRWFLMPFSTSSYETNLPSRQAGKPLSSQNGQLGELPTLGHEASLP